MGKSGMEKNMKVSEAITKRSSTRGYTSESITEDEIGMIIDAGLKAPTATNRQEIFFTVVKGSNPVLKEIEDEKNRLRDLKDVQHNFFYEAPLVIFLSGEKGFKWSSLDAGIAVENMALAAEELGLGNLIIGCVYDALRGEREAEFSKKLAFPENYEFEIALAVGHKAVSKEPHKTDRSTHVKEL